METSKQRRIYDLENRLIEFAALIISVCENLHKTKAGSHLSGQLVRSGTAPALNYGEAQSAESRADFIHKIKIILKELRETRISLLIIEKVSIATNPLLITQAIKESNELISIFRKSAETAQKNMG